MDDFFFSEKEAEGCFDGDMSPSDLEKLEVEEDMPEIPRADLLLRTGLKQQKLSVLVSLPKVLAATNSKENLVTILDAIKHVWKKGEAENDVDIINEVFTCLQNLASITCDGKIITYPMTSLFEEFDAMMRQYHEEKVTAVFLLTDDQVTKQLLPLVLEFVHELQVKDHAEVASHCVAAMIPRLSGSLKKTQIIRIGIEKGDVSQGAGSRLICCLILGVLTASTLLSEQDIDGLFFQKVRQHPPFPPSSRLMTDNDNDVDDGAVSALLPELLELLQDEEEQVKVMAFQTLLSLYDYFPPRDRRDVILPVIAEILEHPPSYLISPLARLFGRLAFKLFTLGDFTSDHIATFQACYTTLSRSDCPDVRLDCARNLPAVVQAFGPAQYSPHLDDLLQAFTQDTSEPIRRSVVSGLHEVAALLGPQRAQRYLKATSLAVFKDESPTVQGHLIACLPSFVPTICTGVDDDTKNTYIDAMLKAILHHHTILAAGRGREQMTVLDALRHFPTFVSSTQLFERVCPLLFELMNAGARPVQVEAARVLVAVNRDNKITANRVNVLLRLRKEYALGKNFWQRTLYLDACNFACDCYSHQYFRTNYLDPAIDLLEV
ncbi:hypothetical protein DYB34_003827 [Aphanomyces astaci]|uniref:TATA-binding protein interacting (TIP20) domain-containing protein n=1 Tax=Aphanomyces astaci TaxID=112090 RepID=A0A3R6W624_APHAT|nr:hypothetical protein DYB34_003827 [Aphanomyces astaci]